MEEAVPFKPVVAVDFYPEDEPFDILMKGFKTSLRTYELFELARIFLDKADRFVFVVEPLKDAEGSDGQLYLSLPAKLPFLSEAEALEHAFAGELENRLEPFEVEVDPPKGNFQVIHRCGVTGKLIGPPNYHRYQELLREHHATEVSNLSFERFRERLVSEKEQAVIDEWVQSQTKQTRYRLKRPSPGTETVESDAAAEVELTETPLGVEASSEAEAGMESGPETAGVAVEGPSEAAPADESAPDIESSSETKEGAESGAEAADAAGEVPAEAAPAGDDTPAEPPSAEDAEPAREFASLAEARQFFRSERREEFVQAFPRLRLNGRAIDEMPRGPLRRSIEAVWEDQKRFPLQTANNLRGKLRRANCHIYKRGKKGISYVCAVRRRLRDPRAVYADTVQRLIDFLDAHPRTKVSELSANLLGIRKEELEASYTPEQREDAEKQLRTLGRDLLWLKSEGYVSEFSDGTLQVQPFATSAGDEAAGDTGDEEPVFSTDSSGVSTESTPDRGAE